MWRSLAVKIAEVLEERSIPVSIQGEDWDVSLRVPPGTNGSVIGFAAALAISKDTDRKVITAGETLEILNETPLHVVRFKSAEYQEYTLFY